jgi:hypothetical protein
VNGRNRASNTMAGISQRSWHTWKDLCNALGPRVAVSLVSLQEVVGSGYHGSSGKSRCPFQAWDSVIDICLPLAWNGIVFDDDLTLAFGLGVLSAPWK